MTPFSRLASDLLPAPPVLNQHRIARLERMTPRFIMGRAFGKSRSLNNCIASVGVVGMVILKEEMISLATIVGTRLRASARKRPGLMANG